MKVWLTGAGGMLGQAVEKLLLRHDIPCLATHRPAPGSSHEGLDVSDRAEASAFAARHRPSHIINCAAHAMVDDAEGNPQAAFRVNADGPENLARAALSVGASLLHFSTDYVFSGDGKTPYKEGDPCGPVGVYARSKREGELRLHALCGNPAANPPPLYIVRASWLFGPGGKNFAQTMLQLMRREHHISVVADQVGRPTYTLDLALAALTLAGILPGSHSPAPSGTYHFANAGTVSWWGFAAKIFEISHQLGLEMQAQSIFAISTAEFPRPAPRPAYSVLCTEKIEAALGAVPRSFELGLREYLESFRATP